MPYLTPDDLPEERDCRALSIPASSGWLAIVSGALIELTKTWNWEQQGTVTVDEAVAAMQGMIAAYYAGCPFCVLPGGYRVIRIGASGHIEQLSDTGDWVDATGDYAFPAVPTRTGGTSVDQICLAAANAENVLHLAYENISDSFAGDLSEAEALTALIEFIIVTIGFEVAPIAYALAMLVLAAFAVLYSAMSYLTADLWDTNFTEAFKCVLVGCATNTSGVVTFDWDCIEHALYARATSFGIDETQLRLYAQINYILWATGGVDMLNAAGGTTAITTPSCGCGWCYVFDFTIDEQGWTLVSPTTYTTGIGFIGHRVDANSATWAYIHITFTAAVIHQIDMGYTRVAGTGGNNAVGVNAKLSGSTVYSSFITGDTGTDQSHSWFPDQSLDDIYLNVNAGTATTTVQVFRCTLRGPGDNPFGSDNCT